MLIRHCGILAIGRRLLGSLTCAAPERKLGRSPPRNHQDLIIEIDNLQLDNYLTSTLARRPLEPALKANT